MATKKAEKEQKVEKEVKAVEAETIAEEKMVSVFVPYIEGEDPEVTLWCNDDNLKFKKGYTVEIPERFAEVLQNANQQAIVARENKEKFKNQRQDW